MANFDFDALDQAINEAPSVGFGPRAQFGKATIEVAVLRWEGAAGGKRKLVTRPFTGGAVDKAKGEYLQVTFHLNVQEMNAQLTKEWKRNVDIRTSDKSSKDQSKWRLADWDETVFPSLKKVFGPTWHKQLVKGVYVELEEIDTVEKDKEGNLRGWDAKEPNEQGEYPHYTNSVPRFVRLFKSKAECLGAYTERYTKKSDMSFGPDGDGEAIPQKVINDAKGLIAAFENPADAIEVLNTSAPFNQYDLATLLTACDHEDLISE